jgi:undecaprenyl-diphosphatase
MTDLLTIFFAKYFWYVLLGVLAVLWLRNFKKYLPLFWQVATAAILSRGIITEAIRFFWQRSRPFVEQDLTPLIEHVASPSFPSGHAALYFAIATIVYAHNKKAGIFFFAGAVLIGMGRVLADIHWPSDIVAGAIVWIISGLLVVQLSKRIWKNA